MTNTIKWAFDNKYNDKTWVAKIDGESARYGLDREFLDGEKEYSRKNRVLSLTVEISEEGLYQIGGNAEENGFRLVWEKDGKLLFSRISDERAKEIARLMTEFRGDLDFTDARYATLVGEKTLDEAKARKAAVLARIAELRGDDFDAARNVETEKTAAEEYFVGSADKKTFEAATSLAAEAKFSDTDANVVGIEFERLGKMPNGKKIKRETEMYAIQVGHDVVFGTYYIRGSYIVPAIYDEDEMSVPCGCKFMCKSHEHYFLRGMTREQAAIMWTAVKFNPRDFDFASGYRVGADDEVQSVMLADGSIRHNLTELQVSEIILKAHNTVTA